MGATRKLKRDFKHARKRYRKTGFRDLTKRSLKYVIRGGRRGSYDTERIDNQERWDFIEKNLDEEDKTFLDIGSAEGFFTNLAAEYGEEATGIEKREVGILKARERYHKINLSFIHQDITPENIESIPSKDVTFVLTVHHHWDKYFGYDEAVRMFQVVAEKTNKIFYEPPGTSIIGGESIDPKESEEKYTEFVHSMLGDSVEVIDTELFDYKGGERKDSLLVIDTSEYQR